MKSEREKSPLKGNIQEGGLFIEVAHVFTKGYMCGCVMDRERWISAPQCQGLLPLTPI